MGKMKGVERRKVTGKSEGQVEGKAKGKDKVKGPS